MSTKLATAATIAAGLVCTWDLPQTAHADPYSFQVDLTPAQTLTDVYFLFGTGVCAGHAYTHKLADAVLANQTSHFSFDLEMDPADRATGYPEKWSIFALYDNANDGVTIGYDSNIAAQVLAASPVPGWVGAFIPTYFGGLEQVEVGTAYTEPFVAQYLRTGLPSPIPSGSGDPTFDFFLYNIGPSIIPAHSEYDPDTDTYTDVPAYYPPLTLLNFSSASFGGTATALEVVPEPASAALLSVVALPLLVRRRPRAH